MRTASFTLAAQDLAAAQRLQLRTHLRKPLIAASVIGLIVLVLFTKDKDRTLLGFVGSIATLVVLAAVLVWILGFLQARESRKLHAQTAAFRHPFTLSWSDQGLRFESESGVCALGWTDFTRIVDDKTTILLHQNDPMAQIIPKRALSADQIADILGAARSSGCSPRL